MTIKKKTIHQRSNDNSKPTGIGPEMLYTTGNRSIIEEKDLQHT